MAPGQNPGLEGESRGVGRDGEKVFILRHHARTCLSFLANDVAENATLFVDIVLLGPFQFFHHVDGKNGSRNELRVRMLERRASRTPAILENQDVFEAAVFL